MATMGAQVLSRLENLESSLTNTDLQMAQEIGAVKAQLESEILEIKQLLSSTEPRSGPAPGGARSLYNSKEFLPSVLGNSYKDQWPVTG